MAGGNAYELKKRGWYHAKSSIYYAEGEKTWYILHLKIKDIEDLGS